MLKQWMGCAPQNRFAGRKGFAPEAIVIHQLDSLDEADRRFADPASSESAHYAVAEDGTVHQYVEEADTAFHAGVVVNASWTKIRTGQNPNLYTIGIVGASGAAAWSTAMYDAVAALVADVASRWRIASDADHVVLHSEIRASKICPGLACDRATLLRHVPSGGPSPAAPASFVQLVTETNLRDGAPRTTARIAATLAAGTDVEVIGFTDQGERIRGSAIWYQTSDDRYLWAGNTAMPQPTLPAPASPAPAPPVPAGPTPDPSLQTPSAPAMPAGAALPGVQSCGIAAIDALFSRTPGVVLTREAGDSAAFGAIQDLLAGHGYRGLPSVLSPAYGRFGNQTLAHVRDFQGKHGLTLSEAVDADLLRKLVEVPAIDPRITQVYMTLGLGLTYKGMQKVVSLVAQMEGVGKFGALNLNTDTAGLSYGLIQWAQRPGRLAELLRAFSTARRDLFVAIFGAGDATVADGLLAFTSRPNGGVVAKTGVTTDPRFDLVAEPWVTRFRTATASVEFQRVQVAMALRAFTASYTRASGFASEMRSERGAAFVLDVANQFGDGGLRRLYTLVRRQGMSEIDLLEAIADQTVEEMPDKFKQGVRARRDSFLNTPLLSDAPTDLLT